MATLRLDGIRKRYPNGMTALHGIDLSVADGELIVVVGPSGCGKSTLLRILAGLEPITAGELAINGRRVNELEPAARDIAMVFQNYALYPHMSVAGNMAYALKNRGTPKDEIRRRVANTAALLGLDDLHYYDIYPPLVKSDRAFTIDEAQYAAYLEELRARFPRLRLIDKADSGLCRAIDAVLRVVTVIGVLWGGMPGPGRGRHPRPDWSRRGHWPNWIGNGGVSFAEEGGSSGSATVRTPGSRYFFLLFRSISLILRRSWPISTRAEAILL